MPDLVEASDSIVAHFITEWGNTTALYFENEGGDDVDATQPWVRLTIRHIDSRLNSVGGDRTATQKIRTYRRDANANVEVFTPSGSGTQRATELAKLVQDILEGRDVNGVDVYDCLPIERGDDGKWYSILVRCSFSYNERK